MALIGSDGSSPRVRGTVTLWHVAKNRVRFIPACAGNSRLEPDRGVPGAVHPRVCGEQLGAIHGTSPAGGSSPRVRGNSIQCPGAVGNGSVHPPRVQG